MIKLLHVGIPKKRLDEHERLLNEAFRNEIREHGSIEIAYGRLVNSQPYRLLDSRVYDKDAKFLRHNPRIPGEPLEETDDVRK